jgi:transposase-like protein
MVGEIYTCPACHQAEPVVRFGFNRGGTQRLRCQECRKTWTPHPSSRALSSEKEVLITSALQERCSQRAIARTFRVARTTVREVLKKSRTKPA